MNKFDIKIGEFASIILDDVNKQSNEMKESTIKQLEEEFDAFELSFLTRAYVIIQEGLRKVDREKNELISKNKMDNRIKLLCARNNIIENIFSNAENALKKFTQSDSYLDYLTKSIEKNIQLIGAGDLTVYLAYTDEKWVDTISKKMNVKVMLESKTIKMIGGCKVYNHARNIFLDDSFTKRLEAEKEGFLEKCNLAIE